MSEDRPSIVLDAVVRELLAKALPKLFGPIDPETLTELEARVERVVLRRGEAPFRQGDPGDAWYVVASGRLRIVAKDADGRERVLNEIGRGASLGETALLADLPRSATPYAVRDSVLLKFSEEHFREIIERHPRTLLSISRTMLRRAAGASTAPAATCLNVAVIAARPEVDVRPFAEELSRALAAFGPTLHLSSTRSSGLSEFARALARTDGHPAWLRFSAWLEERASEHRFIVLEGDPAANAWTRRALMEADRVLVVADATLAPDVHPLEGELLRELAGPHHAQRTLVLVHPPETRLPSGTGRWLDARDVEGHLHVRRGHAGDLGRVARTLGGVSVALVLGAGGARGFAHVGVLRAIEERGLPVDHIGGTSMGAMVAGLYAMGRTPLEIMELGRYMNEARPLGDYALPVTSVLNGRRAERVARHAFGDTQIEDLWVPYYCTACDISVFRDTVLDRGPLDEATLASGAIPGILPPRLRNGHLLVDGGTTDALPGLVMRERCRGALIAVDVSTEREFLYHEDRFPTSWAALWMRMQEASLPTPTLVELFLRAVSLGTASRTAAVARDADLFLRPPVEHFGTGALDAFEEIERLGYEHARERLAYFQPPWAGR